MYDRNKRVFYLCVTGIKCVLFVCDRKKGVFYLCVVGINECIICM